MKPLKFYKMKRAGKLWYFLNWYSLLLILNWPGVETLRRNVKEPFVFTIIETYFIRWPKWYSIFSAIPADCTLLSQICTPRAIVSAYWIAGRDTEPKNSWRINTVWDTGFQLHSVLSESNEIWLSLSFGNRKPSHVNDCNLVVKKLFFLPKYLRNFNYKITLKMYTWHELL